MQMKFLVVLLAGTRERGIYEIWAFDVVWLMKAIKQRFIVLILLVTRQYLAALLKVIPDGITWWVKVEVHLDRPSSNGFPPVRPRQRLEFSWTELGLYLTWLYTYIKRDPIRMVVKGSQFIHVCYLIYFWIRN